MFLLQMRMQLLKKASGYKPFLYNICQSDVCEYLEKRNHPFINIILSSFGNRTNVNKCPIPVSLPKKLLVMMFASVLLSITAGNSVGALSVSRQGSGHDAPALRGLRTLHHLHFPPIGVGQG